MDCIHHMQNHCGTTTGEVRQIHLATLASKLFMKFFLSLVRRPIVHMPITKRDPTTLPNNLLPPCLGDHLLSSPRGIIRKSPTL